MPKTVSTSIASSESTRLCAPVTSMGVRAFACCATCAGLGALGATGTTGCAGLVSLTAVTVSLGQPLSAAVVRAQKNPPVPVRDDGGSAPDLKSIRRAGKVRGLGPQVNSPPARMPCQPARRPIPRSGTVRSLTPAAGPPLAFPPNALVDGPPNEEDRMTTEASVVFVIVVGLRFVLPLFIPKWPLPAILACLVLDGIDQTIFQTFGFDPPGYQNYDKAMDLFYLSIAFLASLQNWTRSSAVGISRFLFFYRMVGVMLFEVTGVRTLLLVFPNTFEYFFIAYEAVRLRWDPRRFTTRFWIITA